MKLYKILLRHCSPKDCVEVIHSYVVANDETALMVRLDKEHNYGIWKETTEEEIEYKKNVKETKLEKMLRLKGEYNNPDASYDDAYYGISHWGWEYHRDISEEEYKMLMKLEMIKDWR